MGLRARLTLLATAVVAVGLLAGSLLVALALHAALLNALDDAGRARARDVAALVSADRLPASLPSGTTLVQVVDEQQRVLSASAGADRLVPLLDDADLASLRRGGTRELAASQVAGDSDLRVVGAAAGPVTVVVAAPLAQVDDSIQLVRRGLLLGGPLLLVAVAALAWVLVGSVLRPVAALRTGAAEITGAGTGRRLPVPAAQDELHRLATTLNDMLDRLDASAERQRAFVADAAHELRSPLAAARTQLEVALAHPAGADWQQDAAGVLADVQRLSALVDDLLLLARTGSAPPRHTVLDLAEVAAQAVARRPGGGPVVRLDAAAPCLVSGERTELGRVVANLLDNAVRHARSSVLVGVRAEGGEVLLSVDDDGPGVGPADRERVFERFTRLDEARARDAGGSGLGLAIVRELVRVHGGSIELGEARLGGLRALVRLPAVRG